MNREKGGQGRREDEGVLSLRYISAHSSADGEPVLLPFDMRPAGRPLK